MTTLTDLLKRYVILGCVTVSGSSGKLNVPCFVDRKFLKPTAARVFKGKEKEVQRKARAAYRAKYHSNKSKRLKTSPIMF